MLDAEFNSESNGNIFTGDYRAKNRILSKNGFGGFPCNIDTAYTVKPLYNEHQRDVAKSVHHGRCSSYRGFAWTDLFHVRALQ